MGVSAAVIRTK